MSSTMLPRRITPIRYIDVTSPEMVKRIEAKTPLKLFIAEWRDRRGLSQDTLAERVGTTKASISRWETGKRDITGESLAAIAQALGLEPQQLFRHPDEQSLDDLLIGVSSASRRKALAVVQALLADDGGQLSPLLPSPKSKH